MILGVAYDEDLANRIRELIASEPDVSEETMFGGLVFLVGGHMSVAAGAQGSLVVRVDPEDTDEFLAKPHAQPFVMGRRRWRDAYASTPRACAQSASLSAGSGSASRTRARFRRSGSVGWPGSHHHAAPADGSAVMRDEPRFLRKETTNGNGGTNPMNATPTLYEVRAQGNPMTKRNRACRAEGEGFEPSSRLSDD
jgi:TfoX/Sxy family transcriptional regulator of competence genes